MINDKFKSKSKIQNQNSKIQNYQFKSKFKNSETKNFKIKK